MTTSQNKMPINSKLRHKIEWMKSQHSQRQTRAEKSSSAQGGFLSAIHFSCNSRQLKCHGQKGHEVVKLRFRRCHWTGTGELASSDASIGRIGEHSYSHVARTDHAAGRVEFRESQRMSISNAITG